MKQIKRLIIILLLTFNFGPTFSQTTNSLSVFPNPFSISATIHFDNLQTDTISLQVSNLAGKILMTYFKSTILPSGEYNINLLGDGLADGTYFIFLKIGSAKTNAVKAIKNSSTTGIHDNCLINKSVIIFPNPSTDFVTIPIEGVKTIIVTDLSGRIIKSLTTDKKTISLKDLASGSYFITILTDKSEILTTQKIVKRE